MADESGDFKLAGAYISVDLKDNTVEQEAAIRARISGAEDTKIKVDADVTAAERAIDGAAEKAKTTDTTMDIKASNPVDAAWRSKVDAAIKSTAIQALDIPLTAETQDLRAEVASTLAQLKKDSRLAIQSGLDPGTADRLKLELQEALAEVDETTKANIKAKADVPSAVEAGKLLGDTASASADESGSRGMSFTAKKWTAAIVAGVLLGAPVLAGAMAGAIETGTAALIIGVEKSTPQVETAFTELGDTAKHTLQQSFSGVTPVIVGAMGQWESAIKGAEPVFAELGQASVPFIVQMNNALLQSGQRILPVFVQGMNAAAPVTHALADGVGSLTTGFIQLEQHMNFQAAGTGLEALLNDVGQLIPTLGNLLNAFMPLGNALLSGVVPAVLDLANDLSGDLAPALQVAGVVVSAVGSALQAISGPVASTAVAVGALALACRTVTSTISAGKSVIDAVKSSWAGLETGVNKVSGQFGMLTVAGQKAAVAQADVAVATAAARKESADMMVTLAEQKAAEDGSAASSVRLTAALEEQAVATAALTEADAALAAAGEATTIAFGPIAAILGLVGVALTAFIGSEASASSSTQQLAIHLQDLESAASGGASGLAKAYSQHPEASGDISQLQKMGVSLKDLTDASNGNVAASQKVQSAWVSLVNQQKQNVAAAQANVDAQQNVTSGQKSLAGQTTDYGSRLESANKALQAAQKQLDSYNGLLGDANNQLQGNKDAASASGQATGASSGAQAAASATARQYGISVDAASQSLANFIKQNNDSGYSVADLTQQWQESETALAAAATTAGASITDHFKQADQAVTQASQSVSNAKYSYQQAVAAIADADYQVAQAHQAVSDADHGLQQAEMAVTDAMHNREQAVLQVQQAEQGVRDAEAGVTLAEENLAKAQLSERDAQLALTQARKAAEEELISLRLQLQDQVASEEQSRLSLFDATQQAATLGITAANAQKTLAQPITTGNEAAIKAALNLVQAQNQLNDTLNTGKNLRDQVNQANSAGINGAAGVISAERALVNAQEQVHSSAEAVLKAQQQVTQAQNSLANANYSLQKASQGVADAQYNVMKAHQAVEAAGHNLQKAEEGVAQAHHNVAQAAEQVTQAERALKDAQDADSRSLDINTKAGAANFALLDSYSKSLIAEHIPTQDRYNKIIDVTSKAFGLSRDAAIAMDNKLGLITTDTNGAATAANNAATAFTNFENSLHGVDKAWAQHYDFQAQHPLNTAGGARYFGGPTAATGMVLPGYAPGRDSIHALLSPGEAVLTPDAALAVGHDNIHALNKRYKPYAEGGIVGYAEGVASVPSAASGTGTPTTGNTTPGASAQGNPAATMTPADAQALSTAVTALSATWQKYAATVNTQVVPAMTSLELNVGTLAVQANQRLDAATTAAWSDIVARIVESSARITSTQQALQSTEATSWQAITNTIVNDENTITQRQMQLQDFMSQSWQNIANSVHISVDSQENAFGALNAGMAGVRNAMAQTADWARVQFGAIIGFAENPIRTVLNQPFNAGLIAAWNSLDSQFQLNKHVPNVAVPFASGGAVRGPGTGTSDSIHAMLSDGEFVVKASVAAETLPFLSALNDETAVGHGEAMQASGGRNAAMKYADGGLVGNTGSEVQSAINKGLAFAAAQNGKPYIWGGVGPDGFDCSGMMSAVTNVLRGEANPYVRLGVAASQPWPGFVPGLSSAWATGFSSTHTAGTLAGTNVESAETPIVFPGRHGADAAEFPGHASLPVVGGQFVPGGAGGFDPNAVVNQAFQNADKLMAAVLGKYGNNIAAQDGVGEAKKAEAGIKQYAVNQLAKFASQAGSVPPMSGNAAAAQKYAQQALAKFGWGPDQWPPLDQLWNRESSWDANSVNKSSGAYGIPQANPSGGQGHPYALGDYANQINWGLNYIKGRYGSPAAAWSHEESAGWYDTGGELPAGAHSGVPGARLALNGTGQPEKVRTAKQEDALADKLDRIAELLASREAVTLHQENHFMGTFDEMAHAAARIAVQQLEPAIRGGM